ncbi:MAG: hypothetical protein IPO06_07695 [Leptospiraceae bacterium]|nr:hypothetical protein [Leptospiraceae bacterium]
MELVFFFWSMQKTYRYYRLSASSKESAIFCNWTLLSLIADRENDSTNEHFLQKGNINGTRGNVLSLGVHWLPDGNFRKEESLLPFYVERTIMILIGIVFFC